MWFSNVTFVVVTLWQTVRDFHRQLRTCTELRRRSRRKKCFWYVWNGSVQRERWRAEANWTLKSAISQWLVEYVACGGSPAFPKQEKKTERETATSAVTKPRACSKPSLSLKILTTFLLICISQGRMIIFWLWNILAGAKERYLALWLFLATTHYSRITGGTQTTLPHLNWLPPYPKEATVPPWF